MVHKLLVTISDELYDRIKLIADEWLIGVSTLVRLAVVERYPAPPPPKPPKPPKPLTARTDPAYREHLALHAQVFGRQPRKMRWEALDYETFCDPVKRADRERKLHAMLEGQGFH